MSWFERRNGRERRVRIWSYTPQFDTWPRFLTFRYHHELVGRRRAWVARRKNARGENVAILADGEIYRHHITPLRADQIERRMIGERRARFWWNSAFVYNYKSYGLRMASVERRRDGSGRNLAIEPDGAFERRQYCPACLVYQTSYDLERRRT